MTEPIEFEKLSGSGNDFICIDDRGDFLGGAFSDGRASRLALALCHRGLGIGADGLIFAVNPEIEGVSHIGARFFEPDGSEAELCGNGTACFLHWAAANGWVDGADVRILTPAGVVRGYRAEGNYVRVCIPDPEDIQTDVELTAGDRRWRCDFAVTGVPHVIAYVDDVDAVDVAHWGPSLRHHERFQPRGANANFVQVLGEGRIALRTFEFGVEAETLACGTGSAAAAILTAMRLGWDDGHTSGQKPIHVTARSGDVLKVWFTADEDGHVWDVCLETLVRPVFRSSRRKPCTPEVAWKVAGPECRPRAAPADGPGGRLGRDPVCSA